MATYKVIQDVEAEDKILGPLTLKQLIFAILVAGFGFGAFRVVTITGSIFTAIPFLPFMAIFGILAAPLSKNQPTEVWLAAQIHYLTKPRVRLWDQNDLKEVVNITVPKKERKNYTDGLNQKQVKSRLSALASTLDSHGWAVKNNITTQISTTTTDDRLINPADSLPVPDEPMGADIFASSGNEAREFDIMLDQSNAEHRKKIKRIMEQAKDKANQTNPEQPAQNTSIATVQESISPPPIPNNQQLVPNNSQTPTQTATNNPDVSEQELYKMILDNKHKQDQQPTSNYNHKVILPIGQTTNIPPATHIENTVNHANTPSTLSPLSAPDPKTLQKNNATMLKDANAYNGHANKKAKPASLPQKHNDEVIVQLH